MRHRLLALTTAALLTWGSALQAGAALTPTELARQLTEALPGYVNREYSRNRVPGTLVLTSNPKLAPAAGGAQAIEFLTLERFLKNGQLYPVLIERTVVVAASGGRWWLSDVRSTFRPVPELLDNALGPYLGDYPRPRYDPPTIQGVPPYIALDGAFARAVTTWLRDLQATGDP